MTAAPTLPQTTDQTFATDVLAATVPVLVDFWAESCAPCHALVPILAALRDAYAGRALVFAIDADANVETAADYGVRGLPTVLLFKNGVLAERLAGAQSRKQYEALLSRHLP